MTRKDYVAVAAIIKERNTGDFRVEDALHKVAQDLCYVFKADNRNFSADRFLTACGFDATEGY